MATQSKITVTDHNFATGEIIEREATLEEIADIQKVSSDEKALRANLG
jgi:hypothetical protein